MNEWANLIATRADVARSICVFSQNPADYVDESRREDFFPRAPAALWQCERSRQHLSRRIVQRLGGPCLEARRAEWPLALLDRARLDKLSRHVTAALVNARARRSLSRAEVLKWRDWLGADAHEFALTRASLLPLGAQAPAVDADAPALQVGRDWIVAASRGWAEPIAQRFMLKLPAGGYPQADAIDRAFAARLVSSVLSIVEPRWCSSFATARG